MFAQPRATMINNQSQPECHPSFTPTNPHTHTSLRFFFFSLHTYTQPAKEYGAGSWFCQRPNPQTHSATAAV